MLQIVEYHKARMAVTERGAAAVEYSLLIALIAAVIVAVVAGLGTKVTGIFSDVTSKI